MYIASYLEKVKTIKILIANGAEFNIKNDVNKIALDWDKNTPKISKPINLQQSFFKSC